MVHPSQNATPHKPHQHNIINDVITQKQMLTSTGVKKNYHLLFVHVVVQSVYIIVSYYNILKTRKLLASVLAATVPLASMCRGDGAGITKQ